MTEDKAMRNGDKSRSKLALEKPDNPRKPAPQREHSMATNSLQLSTLQAAALVGTAPVISSRSTLR
jgi:hypothetical protein